MVIKKTRNEPCTELGVDSEIQIAINGEKKDTIEPTSSEHEFCLPSTKVNVLHDTFQLNSSDSEGFCIESLFVNGNKILGPSSNQNNCGAVKMSTSEIIIRNDEIIYFECKGI